MEYIMEYSWKITLENQVKQKTEVQKKIIKSGNFTIYIFAKIKKYSNSNKKNRFVTICKPSD
jgi:hypothetical protein